MRAAAIACNSASVQSAAGSYQDIPSRICCAVRPRFDEFAKARWQLEQLAWYKAAPSRLPPELLELEELELELDELELEELELDELELEELELDELELELEELELEQVGAASEFTRTSVLASATEFRYSLISSTLPSC